MMSLLGSSSSIFYFFICSRWRQTSLACHHFFAYFIKCSKWWWTSLARRHFLGFFFKCELTGCITTWCIIITPSCTWGCDHPLTNAKVRRQGAMKHTTFGQVPNQKEPHQWCWLKFLMCVGNSFYSICKWAQYKWWWVGRLVIIS
jgi:hypothetical protein